MTPSPAFPSDPSRRTLVILPRGPRSVLRLAVARFKGHAYVEARVFFWLASESKWLPTRKGGTFRFSELDAVIAALEGAREGGPQP